VHLPPTKVLPTTQEIKPRLTVTVRCQWNFPGHKILHSRAYMISMISEKAIRFRHPDYHPDRSQKLISSATSRHLLTRNISSKPIHAFLSNLANRQTDRQTRTKTYTSSFVGGNNVVKYVLWNVDFCPTAEILRKRVCFSTQNFTEIRHRLPSYGKKNDFQYGGHLLSWIYNGAAHNKQINEL